MWKLDRFARNRYDSANYKNILRKNGVRVVSVNEPISDRSEGILLESMLEGFAEYFSADLAEKVSRGMTENALKCKFNGGNPTIGFASDKEQDILIDPVKAPFVLDAFKLYDDGATMSQIRNCLNEHNVLNSRGNPHTVNSVAKILKNRRYIGEYNYRDIAIHNGITFDHKDSAEAITLEDIETALAEAGFGSDLVSFAVPKMQIPIWVSAFLLCLETGLEKSIQPASGRLAARTGPSRTLIFAKGENVSESLPVYQRRIIRTLSQ